MAKSSDETTSITRYRERRQVKVSLAGKLFLFWGVGKGGFTFGDRIVWGKRVTGILIHTGTRQEF